MATVGAAASPLAPPSDDTADRRAHALDVSRGVRSAASPLRSQLQRPLLASAASMLLAESPSRAAADGGTGEQSGRGSGSFAHPRARAAGRDGAPLDVRLSLVAIRLAARDELVATAHALPHVAAWGATAIAAAIVPQASAG